jgi:hypothetical protein
VPHEVGLTRVVPPAPGYGRLVATERPGGDEPPIDWPKVDADRGEVHGAAVPARPDRRLQVRGPVLVGVVLASAIGLSIAAVWAFGVRSTDEGPYRQLSAVEFETEVSTCTVDERGRPVATGSLRNRSGERRTLVVEVEILDPGAEVIDTPRATVESLDDDASVRWQARSPYDVGRLTPLTCRVSDVFAAPGE